MGKRVTAIRKSVGLTQAEFAGKLGITQPSLSAIESGKTPLSEGNIRLICLTFGVNENWLRHGVGEMTDEAAARSKQEDLLLEIFRQLSPGARDLLLEHGAKLAALEASLREEAAVDTGEKKEQPT